MRKVWAGVLNNGNEVFADAVAKFGGEFFAVCIEHRFIAKSEDGGIFTKSE
ncbi:MAG: hypothetical protein H0V76_03380 [Blastocatellia bacterium]|nr:hypothetical protein [Blastocatellia bacterium]